MDTFDIGTFDINIDKLDNEIEQLIAQFYTTFANYKIYDITGVVQTVVVVYLKKISN